MQDGVVSGDESDVDCGDSCANRCDKGAACSVKAIARKMQFSTVLLYVRGFRCTNHQDVILREGMLCGLC